MREGSNQCSCRYVGEGGEVGGRQVNEMYM